MMMEATLLLTPAKKVKDEEKVVESSSSSSSSSDGSSDCNDDEKHVAKRSEEKVVESSSHDTRIVNVTTSDFKHIRNSGSVYVDKTKFLYQLCNPKDDKYYFIARPRRFGKSLLCSSIKHLFSGDEELFNGLYIKDKWDFEGEKCPVIHLDMSCVSRENTTKEIFDKYLFNELRKQADEHNVDITGDSTVNDMVFTNLIVGISKKSEKKVVVIIDEYDKPIKDLVEKPEVCKDIEKKLSSFYGVLKSQIKNLRFVFITGIVKFTSLFSNLNHLIGLTFHPEYATLLGYTKKEVTDNFKPEIKKLAKIFRIKNLDDVMEMLRKKYNGFRFGINVNNGDLSESVFNPFGLGYVFKFTQLSNEWFRSSTPTFFLKTIAKQGNFSPHNFSKSVKLSALTTSCTPYKFDLVFLSYYSGYSTLSSYDTKTKMITLTSPNEEISSLLDQEFLNYFCKGK
jgi:hypothetical protein